VESNEHIEILDVVPTEDSIWLVIIDGGILAAFRERKDAVKVATALAAKHPPSRLLTRSGDGDIEAITPFNREGRAHEQHEESLALPKNDSFHLS
jgi:hypothetical protein